MEIKYKNKNVIRSCNDLKYSTKKYGKKEARKILKAISYIQEAKNLHDVILYSPFKFHNLEGNRKGQFTIAPAGKKSNIRIILIPLDDNENQYTNYSVDEFSKTTKVILILEVSNHYE